MSTEIELNSLIGHSESNRKKTDAYNKPTKRSASRGGMNLCHVFLGLVVLFMFFGILKYDEAHDEDHEEAQLFNPKAPKSKPEKSKTTDKEGTNCVDDPDFRFEDNPENGCDWVAAESRNDHTLCAPENKNIRDDCPVACGVCFAKADGEMQIVDGIDDKEVYCEDLTQYDDWHNVKITKADGIKYEVVEQIDHDRLCFTQGLTYARGKIFESGGLYGQSNVRILNRNTAEVEKKVPMEKNLFAEGMTYYKDKLVQITWKSQRGFIYDISSLEQIDEFRYSTTKNEGWGITWDRCNDQLIVTDGSANLHFWNPSDMSETRPRLKVTRMNGRPAKNMNEIEYWRGRVLANVWYEDVVLVINPETGVVEKEYDFSQLWPKIERQLEYADVLNGISISEDSNILYLTGKKWNRMYKIKLLPELY